MTGFLQVWKRKSPLLSMYAYAPIMFDNGLHNIQMIQKVYAIIADDPEKPLDFISGSSLISYLERMLLQELFIAAFKNRIQKALNSYCCTDVKHNSMHTQNI